MKNYINIVWFKRDLRIHDHKPLYSASLTDNPIMPLYIVEPKYWEQHFASRRHWHFIYDCLLELRNDCEKLGQSLFVKTGESIEVFEQINKFYKIQGIYTHEESGNGWTYERDKSVTQWCKHSNVSLFEYPCNGVVRGLKSRDDWSKIRNTRMAEKTIPKPMELTKLSDNDIGNIPQKNDPMFGADVPGITQQGGRRAGIQVLKSFLEERGKEYIYRLSAPGPSEKYCSRLSPHLTWGTLSIKEVVHSIKNRVNAIPDDEFTQWKRNMSAFSSRLSWRCHFIQKIEDQPEIEYQCMHPAFEGIHEPEHNEVYYQAWISGQTGYPFIDACMRNLTYEGWITFRMRAMLVSFASYHLWLDWRKTGYHLARLFTDYEPGIHYSQLQMQSGVTGINAIRMYNPIKQSQEHDPDGKFIKKWLPELIDVPNEWIHEPWKMNNTLFNKCPCIIGQDYPFPIVEHSEAIKSARKKLATARKSAGFEDEAQKIYEKLGSRKRTKKSIKTNERSSPMQLKMPI